MIAQGYRRDIGGLRGIAIAVVVLCHAHVAGFSGGYVGVDVFFVISGFLITRLLLEQAASGHLDLWRFYERRVRRMSWSRPGGIPAHRSPASSCG